MAVQSTRALFASLPGGVAWSPPEKLSNKPPTSAEDAYKECRHVMAHAEDVIEHHRAANIKPDINPSKAPVAPSLTPVYVSKFGQLNSYETNNSNIEM